MHAVSLYVSEEVTILAALSLMSFIHSASVQGMITSISAVVRAVIGDCDPVYIQRCDVLYFPRILQIKVMQSQSLAHWQFNSVGSRTVVDSFWTV